ncbi:MAG: TRIC cation channel family protein [Campylobacter sp.]
MENNLLLFTEQISIASAALGEFLFAVRQNCDYLGIFLAGFLAALGVGILRDVLLNKLPWLLKTGLYGTIRACLFFIKFMRFYKHFAVITLFCGGVIFRLIAYYKSWYLPNFNSI